MKRRRIRTRPDCPQIGHVYVSSRASLRAGWALFSGAYAFAVEWARLIKPISLRGFGTKSGGKNRALDHVVWNTKASMQPGCLVTLTGMGQSGSVPANGQRFHERRLRASAGLMIHLRHRDARISAARSFNISM